MAKIYPISPPQIVLENFLPQLEKVLAAHRPDFFQLRLKDAPRAEIISAAKKIIPICHAHGTKFILNDFADLALEVDADGVHVGDDENVAATRKKIGGKILGVSCYNSADAAIAAVHDGADLVSFGAFYPTKTKTPKARAEIATLKNFKQKMPAIKVCAIGGINFENSAPLENAGADYLCMISAFWN